MTEPTTPPAVLSDEEIRALWPGDDYGETHEVAVVIHARAIEAAVLQRLAAPAPAAPGWKLVPVEPTQEMVDAGFRAFVRYHKLLSPADDAMRMVWDAMLEAAPAAPFTDDDAVPNREDDGDNAWFHDPDMGDR